MGTAIERLAAHEWRRPARDADLEQHLPVECAFADGMVAVIGAIERVVRPDMQTVGAVEQRLAPGIEQVSIAVEDHHRVLAAIEHIDPVLPIDGDRSDVSEAPTRRQFCPVADDPVGVLAGADDAVRCAHAIALPSRSPLKMRDYRSHSLPRNRGPDPRRPTCRASQSPRELPSTALPTITCGRGIARSRY